MQISSFTTTARLSDERSSAIQGSFNRQGFLTGLGAALKDIGGGRCAIELPFGPQVSQQQGFFPGAVLGALADSAGGYVGMTMASPGTDVLTLEYKINFLRPAAGEAVIAIADVLRAGKSVIVTRIAVHVRRGEEFILCAAAQQSVVPAHQS